MPIRQGNSSSSSPRNSGGEPKSAVPGKHAYASFTCVCAWPDRSCLPPARGPANRPCNAPVHPEAATRLSRRRRRRGRGPCLAAKSAAAAVQGCANFGAKVVQPGRGILRGFGPFCSGSFPVSPSTKPLPFSSWVRRACPPAHLLRHLEETLLRLCLACSRTCCRRILYFFRLFLSASLFRFSFACLLFFFFQPHVAPLLRGRFSCPSWHVFPPVLKLQIA